MAASSSSPTVPPVEVSEANSSRGVVRKSYHHHGRGIALTTVLRVNCGGMEKPLRWSRRRAPATGTSTVKNKVSNPGRRSATGEFVGDLSVAHYVELEPVAPVGIGRLDPLDRGRTKRGQGERNSRRARSCHLALGMHQPGEPGRRDAERQGGPATEDRRGGVDLTGPAQDGRGELDVFECLAGPVHRDLGLGSAVGVVERRARRAPLRDRAQVVDGQRAPESALLAVQLRLLETHQLEDLARLGQLTCDHDTYQGS